MILNVYEIRERKIRFIRIPDSEKTSFISMPQTTESSFRWNLLDKRSRGTVSVINFSYPREAITIFFSSCTRLEREREIERE